jgi:hypothetical protein
MQQFQSDLAGYLPERGILSRAPAIPMRMASDGIALLGAMPLADPVVERCTLRLLSPAALIEGVDHRLARLAAQPHKAVAFAMTLPPLANLSNGFFRVHPRRNDRLVAVTPALRSLFPGVDFLRFDFTGHLLTTLEQADPVAFLQVRSHLQALWCARMHRCLELLPPVGVLIDPCGLLPALPLKGARKGLSAVALNPQDPVQHNAALLAQAFERL